MPIRKVGSDTPTSDRPMIAWLSQPSRRSAVYTPSAIPSASAPKPEISASSSVAGRRSAITSATGRAMR